MAPSFHTVGYQHLTPGHCRYLTNLFNELTYTPPSTPSTWHFQSTSNLTQPQLHPRLPYRKIKNSSGRAQEPTNTITTHKLLSAQTPNLHHGRLSLSVFPTIFDGWTLAPGLFFLSLTENSRVLLRLCAVSSAAAQNV